MATIAKAARVALLEQDDGQVSSPISVLGGLADCWCVDGQPEIRPGLHNGDLEL